MTPLQVFSELDGQRRFVAPFLPAPRVATMRAGRSVNPVAAGRYEDCRPAAVLLRGEAGSFAAAGFARLNREHFAVPDPVALAA